MKLRGKVALVTGSGRGLGRAYALRLAALGADVVINDVNLDAAREFNERLSAPTVMDEVRAAVGGHSAYRPMSPGRTRWTPWSSRPCAS